MVFERNSMNAFIFVEIGHFDVFLAILEKIFRSLGVIILYICDWNIQFSVGTSFVFFPFIKKEMQMWQSGVVLIQRRTTTSINHGTWYAQRRYGHGVLVLCRHPQDNYPCCRNTVFWNRRTNPKDDTRILSTNDSTFWINSWRICVKDSILG